jgi:uncharacterized membrane protein
LRFVSARAGGHEDAERRGNQKLSAGVHGSGSLLSDGDVGNGPRVRSRSAEDAMNELNQGLLILHLLGLTMGFAVSFANMVLHGVVVKAAPQERDVLSRFSTAMSRVGDVGLALLWVTGLLLVYTKWGGFDVLPWQFQVKMAAVVILTGLVGYIHTLMRKARTGNTAAAARIPVVGRLAFVAGLTAVAFAVLTFD